MATIKNGRVLAIISFALFLVSLGKSEDLPCAARNVGIEGRSIVCVCNATYCDTITREIPAPRSFVRYTSSKDGKRFEKSYGSIQSLLNRTSETVEDIDPIDISIDTDEDEKEKYFNFDFGANFTDEFQDPLWKRVVIRVYTIIYRQEIEGFGGSVTDAAAINWRKLSDGAQRQFIDTYFSNKGIEYNMIRVPIGGSDFSTHPYAYNELPWNDVALTNFTLSEEDLFYKLPLIRLGQAAAAATNNEVKITASTWSPPVWMKSNERITGFGQLKPEFYQTYADYHIRFMEAYARAHVNIWAITTTNEPLNGIVPVANFNSLGWTPGQLGRWVANNLGPTLRNSSFSDTLILAVDDQRYVLPAWLRGITVRFPHEPLPQTSIKIVNKYAFIFCPQYIKKLLNYLLEVALHYINLYEMEREDPRSIDFIDGIAIHYYGNFVPSLVLSRIQQRYPNKILLSTEASEGSMPWNREKVAIGSWRRAKRYISSIIEDLNRFVVGWIDWNLCLDSNGGPNWASNFVDSPILVYPEEDEFVKQPMYYAVGHFSKFIPRRSRRIGVERWSLFKLENVAVLTPEGTIVVVMHNRRKSQRTVHIFITRLSYITFVMEPESVSTIEINPNTESD